MASNLWTFQEYESDNKNVTTNAALNMNLWIQPQKCAHEQITGVVVKKKCILRDVSKSVHQTGLNFSRAFWRWDVIINGALGGAEFLIGHFSDQERAAWLKLEQDIAGGIFATYPSPEFASLERSELFSIMWESTQQVDSGRLVLSSAVIRFAPYSWVGKGGRGGGGRVHSKASNCWQWDQGREVHWTVEWDHHMSAFEENRTWGGYISAAGLGPPLNILVQIWFDIGNVHIFFLKSCFQLLGEMRENSNLWKVPTSKKRGKEVKKSSTFCLNFCAEKQSATYSLSFKVL